MAAIKNRAGEAISSGTNRNPVSKTLIGLNWLIQQPAEKIGVRQMAIALQMGPSTAHRIFAALSESGFVEKDPATGRFKLGLELFRFAQLVVARAPIGSVARRHMRKLADACNETVLLGLYNDLRQEMMFSEVIESKNTLRYVVSLNAWIPIHAGASGLAILAFLPEDIRHSIMSRSKLESLTSRTITEPYRLEDEIEKIRSRGYAISHGQRIAGAIGMAAPICGIGTVLGDVCLTIPEARFDPTSESRLAALLMACAEDIAKELGLPSTR
jgi:IclR family acetate operon transcriptional repressor